MALTIADGYPTLTQAERDAICDAIRELAAANLGADSGADSQRQFETSVNGLCTVQVTFSTDGERMHITFGY